VAIGWKWSGNRVEMEWQLGGNRVAIGWKWSGNRVVVEVAIGWKWTGWKLSGNYRVEIRGGSLNQPP
jgi:hypothetical protein